MAKIELKNVTKSYGAVQVIKGIDLTIEKGEFMVFVGPSGCGKSTLLRLISGLEEITTGDMTFDGERVNNLIPSKRGIAMVFQSYALYPHMKVYDNMAFGMKLDKTSDAEIRKRVEAAAKLLQIDHLLDRLPKQLSGGQRQRVAIGRAIVRNPEGFLFDEPLSNLDAALRVNMRLEIMQMHKDLGATMIYVTHDQVEAMTMADRIVVLNRGNIEQVGSPLELYNRPDSLFVAGFIGSPKMNLISGKPAEKFDAHTIGIRPEHLGISLKDGTWSAKISLAEHLGADTFLHVDAGPCGMMTVRAAGEYDAAPGAKIFLTPEPDRIHRFDKDGRAIRK